MDQDQLKAQVAQAAMAYVEDDMIVGVGTGSTVNHFIEALAAKKGSIEGTVASSEESARRLKELGIPVFDLNSVNQVHVYIDGADEVDAYLYTIKGGGGALTREKIIATVAKKFICIVDESKRVDILGVDFPLPVEVIPLARSYVAREIVKLGGDPVYRENFVTDNGNIILDVHNLKIMQPLTLEQTINNIVGVVCNGIFSHRAADVLLVAKESGVETVTI